MAASRAGPARAVLQSGRQEGGGAIIPDNPNWRRFRHACPQYREHWAVEDLADAEGRPLLYQIICLQNTPPLSVAEQQLCLQARKKCWRLTRKRGCAAAAEPVEAGEPAGAQPAASAPRAGAS